MSDVYITGHRNPDMDTVCSALGLADLKNLTDPSNNYIPVICSHMSDGLESILNTLGITPPEYKRDVYPKVSDVMMSSEISVDASATLSDYAAIYKASNPSAIPVFDGETFLGLISVDDITLWTMKKLSEDGVVTGTPTIGEIMRGEDIILTADQRFEDAKTILSSGKRRGLPVYEGDKYVGYVTRRCFLDMPKNNVIMVDHNEQAHSIKGIETANVVGIVDHHRLNALKTDLPLFIDAEPLGSTCTIVYQLFLRNGIRPTRTTARILLSGILADTLILKSPTTTSIDRESAGMLAAMCGETVESYGLRMFSNMGGLKGRNPGEAIAADFKQYDENGMKIGIGQCETTTLQDINDYSEIYLESLEKLRLKNGLDWALVMITDVIKEHSVLLSTDCHSEQQLNYAELAPHMYDMPGVMSRKKQLLPEILHSISPV